LAANTFKSRIEGDKSNEKTGAQNYRIPECGWQYSISMPGIKIIIRINNRLLILAVAKRFVFLI